MSNRPNILSCSLPDDVKGTSFFVRTVVNASLLQKEFGPGKAFIGLFPHTQSVEESPLPHLGMLTTTTPSKCDKEIGSAYFHNNEMKFTGEYVAEEHSIPGFNERRLLRGEKKEIPQLGTQFIGEVTEEVFSGNPQRLFRKRTGIWGDLGNGLWGLTQQGTREVFGPNGKIRGKWTGIWEDRGNGLWNLTQQGTYEIFGPDGMLTRKLTGTWGDQGNGHWGLTQQGTSEEFGTDGKRKSITTGIWTDLGNGKWDLVNEPQNKKPKQEESR